MKIVFLGENDLANTSYRIARAINTRRGALHARAVMVIPHPFGYPEDVVIARDGEDAAREAVRDADWIISSGDGKYDVLKDLITRLGSRISEKIIGLSIQTELCPSHARRCNQSSDITEMAYKISWIGSKD